MHAYEVGGWTLHGPDGSYPAEVPGSVHTDLLAAGVIEDPYRGLGEERLRWMYDVDWRYSAALSTPPPRPGERVDLVFGGIDTVGVVRLGGVELGRTFNMHRSYRYDVTGHLGESALPLDVELLSATAYAEKEMERLGDRPRALPGAPYNFVRKMACSFGWDWGPDLRTAGLWKPVVLERWSVARLASVRPVVGRDAVSLHVDLDRLVDGPLTLTVEILGHRAEVTVEGSSAEVIIEVPDAPLWWPTGYGAQPLFGLVLILSDGEGELDRWERQVGFRTVSLDTSPDEIGSKFTLSVNGRPIFAKGANWIPDDHFLTRITPERLARRLDQAVAANLNLIRVWGGGIFETEDFYRACDERGILVWQDFPLACAAYPEEQPLRGEIEAEARENIVRLASHPSLALYNGGNENLWGHEDWDWQSRLGDRTWGSAYAFEIFPELVAELDPARPYSPNSPSSPGYTLAETHPNDPDHGSHHQWEVWNRIDYTAYRSEIPRFCSEFGFQAPPTWRTLTDWMPASDKTDPVFLLHQKAVDGNGKLDRGLAPHLGVPADFGDWHWATQLNQARAVTYAIDHYRRWWPRTAGAVVWQLNDCWPVTSWAAIDSLERPKPLWFALRHAFAPRRLVLDDDSVCVLNDADSPWNGTITVVRQRFDGHVLATASIPVAAAPRSAVASVLPAFISKYDDAAFEVIVARLEEFRAVHTFAPDIALALDPDPLDVTVTPAEDGYDVTVTARSLALDITLLPDRLAPDATVDEALVTLPAGESTTFRVRTAQPDLDLSLSRAPVLRAANDLRR